jgi:hypothetical protein
MVEMPVGMIVRTGLLIWLRIRSQALADSVVVLDLAGFDEVGEQAFELTLSNHATALEEADQAQHQGAGLIVLEAARGLMEGSALDKVAGRWRLRGCRWLEEPEGIEVRRLCSGGADVAEKWVRWKV